MPKLPYATSFAVQMTFVEIARLSCHAGNLPTRINSSASFLVLSSSVWGAVDEVSPFVVATPRLAGDPLSLDAGLDRGFVRLVASVFSFSLTLLIVCSTSSRL